MAVVVDGVRFDDTESLLSSFFESECWEYGDLVRSLMRLICRRKVSEFMDMHADSLPSLTPLGFSNLIGLYARHARENPRSDAAERFALHIAGFDNSERWLARRALLSDEQWRLLTLLSSAILADGDLPSPA